MYSGPLQTSTVKLLTRIVNNINIKSLTVLAKRSISGAGLGPEFASADKYNTVLKMQMNISP